MYQIIMKSNYNNMIVKLLTNYHNKNNSLINQNKIINSKKL